MRKNIFILIALMSYPALAQISSGTSVVFNFAKDELIVAADSRQIGDPSGTPDDSDCKIHAFRHQFIFTGAGGARHTKASPADPIEAWDNVQVARDVLRNATKGMTIDDAFMDAVAGYWARIVESNWNTFCTLDRWSCMKRWVGTQLQHPELTAGVFVGAKGLFVRGASISFDMTKLLNPVDSNIGSTLSQCWPCGQGEQICAIGSHVDVAAQVCASRKANTKIAIRTTLIRADKHAKLAVEIVEKTIAIYGKTPGDVGGDVDVVTITKHGRTTWNARKSNCPENQD